MNSEEIVDLMRNLIIGKHCKICKEDNCIHCPMRMAIDCMSGDSGQTETTSEGAKNERRRIYY